LALGTAGAKTRRAVIVAGLLPAFFAAGAIGTAALEICVVHPTAALNYPVHDYTNHRL
jgi:hypothetical protein